MKKIKLLFAVVVVLTLVSSFALAATPTVSIDDVVYNEANDKLEVTMSFDTDLTNISYFNAGLYFEQDYWTFEGAYFDGKQLDAAYNYHDTDFSEISVINDKEFTAADVKAGTPIIKLVLSPKAGADVMATKFSFTEFNLPQLEADGVNGYIGYNVSVDDEDLTNVTGTAMKTKIAKTVTEKADDKITVGGVNYTDIPTYVVEKALNGEYSSISADVTVKGTKAGAPQKLSVKGTDVKACFVDTLLTVKVAVGNMAAGDAIESVTAAILAE